MRRLLPLFASLALALVACAPTSTSPSTTEAAVTETTAAPDTTTGGDSGATTTSPVPDSTGTTSDRPLAPDFTLELGDGGSYTLSEGEKPVYLVFWAEW